VVQSYALTPERRVAEQTTLEIGMLLLTDVCSMVWSDKSLGLCKHEVKQRLKAACKIIPPNNLTSEPSLSPLF